MFTRNTELTLALQFVTTDIAQIDEVAALLQRSFRVEATHPSLDRSYLAWKYYELGPEWPGSRSYVLSDSGRFLAHAAIWPIQLKFSDGVRHGIGFGDWVADEEHRGIGLMLLKKLTSLASFVLVTGGGDITRQILPRVGFEHWIDRPVFAKVLRPLRQFSTRGSNTGWKEPARIGRNFLWSRSANASPMDWTIQAAEPDERTLALACRQSGPIHTESFLRYLLKCPIAHFRYFELSKGGAPQGYTVLSEILGQGRIADLRIASEDQLDWNAAVSVVLSAMKAIPTICEAMAFGSTPAMNEAFRANGFQIREQRPMVVFDTEGKMTQQSVPHLGMLEDDASVLYDPQYPYLT